MPHHNFMRLALSQAETALNHSEFPVGCVITFEDKVIAEGHRLNSYGTRRNEMDHAEIVALRNMQKLDYLPDLAQVYVYSTMEPCLMCYATLLVNGITNIVYAYEDVMGGGTCLPLEKLNPLYRNLTVSITGAVLRQESLELFYHYFNNPQHDYLRHTQLGKAILNHYAEITS